MTIGIPVYQGANYLDETIEAVRAQDYDDLEIVVSDNASTDETAEIISRHASADSRIVHLTQVKNVGAAENYNVVFREATGDLFGWNAHDDFHTKGFLTEAVAIMEAQPEVSVAVAPLFKIDEVGEIVGSIDLPADLQSDSPARRFRAAARTHPVLTVFGIFRTSQLSSTSLHGHYTGSDRNLVAEMMLHGKVGVAADSRLYLREHAERSVRAPNKGPGSGSLRHAREAWFAPERAGKIVFPTWRRFGGYLRAIMRAPISNQQRVECAVNLVAHLGDDGFKFAKYLLMDLAIAVATVTRRFTKSSP